MTYRSGVDRHSRFRLAPAHTRRVAAAALVLFFAIVPAACASPGIGDRISGKLIVAQDPAASPQGPQLEVPTELTGQAEVQAYEAGGKVGSQMLFQTVTFGQFNQLGEVVTQTFDDTSTSMRFRVQRSGDTVVLSGTADMSALAPNAAVVVLSVQFPGPVTATNGQQESDDLVTWTLNAGTSATLTAEAVYADPSIAAFSNWALITTLVALGTAIIVAALAYVARDRSPKVGREAEGGESLVEIPQWLREKLKR